MASACFLAGDYHLIIKGVAMSNSVSLQKNSSINLTKAAQDAGATAPLSKLKAGAGWDVKGQGVDLDLLAVYLADDGKAIPDANNNGTNLDEAVTFFNNLNNEGATHNGDNRTGAGEGDDETIDFDLSSVPENVKEIAIVVASYGNDGSDGPKFSEVENAFVRLVNIDGNNELGKFELKDGLGDTKGVELGRIKRNGSDWEFKTSGTPINGDTFGAIVASYGVTGV